DLHRWRSLFILLGRLDLLRALGSGAVRHGVAPLATPRRRRNTLWSDVSGDRGMGDLGGGPERLGIVAASGVASNFGIAAVACAATNLGERACPLERFGAARGLGGCGGTRVGAACRSAAAHVRRSHLSSGHHVILAYGTLKQCCSARRRRLA